MYVASRSHLVVHRNGESRIEHQEFRQVAEFEKVYVFSIPLAARVDSIMPCGCADVGSFQLIRANALERAVGWNRVQLLTDPQAAGPIRVDGLLLQADEERVAVGDDDGGITVVDQSDLLSIKVLDAPDLSNLLRYTQHNGWAMRVEDDKPFKFSYQLSMPKPPEVLLDVRYTKRDGMKLVRWVSLESPFPADDTLITVVETMDDRRPVERERMQYRTMAAAPAAAYAAEAAPEPTPQSGSNGAGFADEYRQDAVVRTGVARGHNRVRLPEIETSKEQLVYIAELKAAQTVQVQRQPYRRLSWESDDFVLSGYASVSVHDEDVQRVWFDAWKHPTRQWIDLPGSTAVMVYRQVHSQRTTQEGVELVVRIEAYNRTEETIDVMVQEYMPKGAGPLEQAGEEWAHRGGVPVQKMRLAAEKLDFDYSKHSGKTAGWRALEPSLLFDGTYWRKAVDPETGVPEKSTWELKMEDIPPKSGRLFLYKTMKA